MKKLKIFFDYDREEEWLNEMAQQGFRFVGKTFAYQFKKAEPENAVIKIDHRPFRTQVDYENYLTLFEDCGWQHIAGKRRSGKQYFLKNRDDGSDSIFSDSQSKAERYQRIARNWARLASLYIFIILILSFSGNYDWNALIKPSLFYLTPSLWQMEGEAFRHAFWLETPFAIFRAFLLYSLPCLLFLSIYFRGKAGRYYRRDIDTGV